MLIPAHMRRFTRFGIGILAFVPVKKRKKHPWKSVTFVKLAGFRFVFFCKF